MTIPTIKEILEASKTEDGINSLISNFRTKTHGYTVEEALTLKQTFDSEVGEFAKQLHDAAWHLDYYEPHADWRREEQVWSVFRELVSAYGYDNYENGSWIDSGY